MADFGDDDFYDDDYGDDWLYVEDEYDLADELAESQIASPGYAGTKYEIDAQGYDFELFDYWNDLEYADGALWDEDERAQHLVSGAQIISAKRRRLNNSKNVHISEASYQYDPLLFWSRAEREKLALAQAPLVQSSKTYALIPDWRVRLAGEPESRLGANGEDDLFEAAVDAESDLDDADEFEEEEGNSGDECEDGEDEGGLAIDPEVLQAILKERLGRAGLGDMDEASFMQTIGKLLSGNGQADDAAGELANTLLGKLSTEDGGGAMSEWLSGQGVSLDGEDDDGTEATLEDNASSTTVAKDMVVEGTANPRNISTSRKRALDDETPVQAPAGKKSRNTAGRHRP